jgi:16S rRNA processing protein RimM
MLDVGQVVKPHGIRGEVIVSMVSNRADLRLAPGAVLASSVGELRVERATAHQGRWIVSFAGVTDRNRAEALRGVALRAEPIEEEGALWVHELIGSEVVDVSGRSYGPVEAVEANPASDLLVLGGERLVPLTFVVDRRAADGAVVIDPPPGLLDD